jgi:hypothetical protein
MNKNIVTAMVERRILFVIVLALLLMAVSPDLNSTERGMFKLYGAGVNSCGKWLSDRKADRWYDEGQWLLGWVSAVGYYGVANLRQTDSDAIAAWLDNYCQAHPLDQLDVAADHLVDAIRN